MKTLAKYHVCNHCVIGEKTLKNILIGPGKLSGLSRNRSLVLKRDWLPEVQDKQLNIFNGYQCPKQLQNRMVSWGISEEK